MRWCRTPCQRPLRIQPEMLGVEGRGLWTCGWGISGGGLTAQPVSVGPGASAGKWGVKAKWRGALPAFPKDWRKVSLEGRLGPIV